MIKYFKHKGKYLFAVFLLVFSYAITCFTSLTASAASSSGGGLNFVHHTSAPVVMNYNYSCLDEANNYCFLSINACPSISFGYDDEYWYSESGTNNGSNPFSYFGGFVPYPNGSFLDTDGKSVFGYYSGTLTNGIGQSTLLEQYDLEYIFITFTPFYCWGPTAFDSYITSLSSVYDYSFLRNFNSEISFDFYSDNVENWSVGAIELTYSRVGSDVVQQLTVLPEDFVYLDGYVTITPSLLGDDDPNAVYYISSMSVRIDNLPSYVYQVRTVSDVVYVLNPLIYDLVTNLSSSDSNPADGLIPYTDWIGNAVSGFFDAELFPGFTLGGVFMTLFSFSCVIWFLKLVAGG